MATAAAELLDRLRIRDFLHWWAGELAALLPPQLRRIARSGKERLVLSMQANTMQAACERGGAVESLGTYAMAEIDPQHAAAVCGELISRASRCSGITLRLAADSALQKVVQLPLAAEENLRQVIGFEMDRQTPFKADQVYYDYRVATRDAAARRLLVRLTVVPRQGVDEVLHRLSSCGVQPDRIEVSGTPGIDLLPQGRRPVRHVAGRRINTALGVLVAALLVAVIAVPLWRQSETIHSLEPSVAQAKRDAEQAVALRDQLEGAIRESRVLVNKRLTTPLVIEVLNELTTLLPDDTWLSSVDVRDAELRIQGESSGASALIATLEASPLFSGVHFSSPVTQNPASGSERFQLSSRIVANGGQ